MCVASLSPHCPSRGTPATSLRLQVFSRARSLAGKLGRDWTQLVVEATAASKADA